MSEFIEGFKELINQASILECMMIGYLMGCAFRLLLLLIRLTLFP